MHRVAAESGRELDLKRRAIEAVAGLDRSPAAARQADASIRPGSHGRRRHGTGEEFWQFRMAADGDPARLIDWRRSAKSDEHFVRDKEMQTSNSVIFWADNSRSMQFSGNSGLRSKADRSRLIALAAAIVLVRGEERVGVLGCPGRLGSGMKYIDRMTVELFGGVEADYGVPENADLPGGASLVLLSDFLAPLDQIREAVRKLAGRKTTGILVQVLDPSELSFPFDGRTLFRSMSGSMEYESLQAGGLRRAYQERLRERMSAIGELASEFAWQSRVHLTDSSIRTALHWLCDTLGTEA